MADNYKLCPKCNNALDLNVTSCPYCWESMWISFWWNQIKQGKRQNVETKKAVRLVRFIVILFVLPIITSVITFIIWLISEIFDGIF